MGFEILYQSPCSTVLSDSQQSSDTCPPHTQDKVVVTVGLCIHLYTATSHVKGLLAMIVYRQSVM